MAQPKKYLNDRRWDAEANAGGWLWREATGIASAAKRRRRKRLTAKASIGSTAPIFSATRASARHRGSRAMHLLGQEMDDGGAKTACGVYSPAKPYAGPRYMVYPLPMTGDHHLVTCARCLKSRQFRDAEPEAVARLTEWLKS